MVATFGPLARLHSIFYEAKEGQNSRVLSFRTPGPILHLTKIRTTSVHEGACALRGAGGRSCCKQKQISESIGACVPDFRLFGQVHRAVAAAAQSGLRLFGLL